MEFERRFAHGAGAGNDPMGPSGAAVPGKRTLVQDLPAPAAQPRGDAGAAAAPAASSAERTSAPPGQIDRLFGRPGGSGGSAAGNALPDPVRGKMEHAFGVDFSAVRVHVGAEATALGAQAFARGTDLHFAPGRYDPDSQAGHELIGHELAHVVQQSQGRVSATTQAKTGDGSVALNADASLEHEADAMGARAARGEQVGGGATGLAGLGSGAAVVQRKVGLEIEMPSFHLAKGVMKEDKKPEKDKKPKPESKKPSMERLGLLAESSDDEDGYGYGYGYGSMREREQPFDQVDEPIVKGAPIVSGTGWSLTADIIGGTPVVEFITDPVDETKQADRLPQIVTEIQNHVRSDMALEVPGYKQLPKKHVLIRGDDALEGNIQITGGIRPDRIIQLLEAMSGWDGKGSDLKVDASSRAVLGHAVESAKQASKDPSYQGLVALLAGYVGGNRRIDEVVEAGYQQLRDQRHDGDICQRVAYCVGEDELKEYVSTGQITDKDSLSNIEEMYEGNFDAFTKELQTVLTSFMAPRAAKMQVPVLSRSSLAELQSKTQIQDADQFKVDVMTAAGLEPKQLGQRLFPFGLDTPGHDNRTIEATPDITINQWLQSILAGRNLTFTDTTKSFENVGPGTPYCCFFESREKGAVLEIRALDGKQLVPLARWVPLAQTVVQTYQQLNKSDDD